MHAYQGKTFIELIHPGRCAAVIFNEDMPNLAATGGEYQGRPVKGLDENDMERIINQYRKYAGWIRRSGFDGIQLHFAHGWLVHDFWTSWKYPKDYPC